jgi:copper homeostasis protein (lipoprotein)
MTGMAFRTWMPILFLCGALAIAAACGGAKESPAPATQDPVFKPIELPPPAALAATPGVTRYWGILPCADCAGIRHELLLTQDPKTGEPQTYELVETYLGSMSNDGERAVSSRGKWSQSKRGQDGAMTIVRLDGGGRAESARSFERVSETELRLLDREQKRIESTHPLSLIRVSDTAGQPGTLAPGSLIPAAPVGASAPVTLGAGEPTAMVTDLASGWPVTLGMGQEMTARLTADRAAGGRWTLRPATDGGVVLRQGEPAYEKTAAGGVEVFRFKAVKSGQTLLTFDYRMGAATTIIKSASYPVTVQ